MLMEAIPVGNVFVLRSAPGMGRTTVLTRLHREVGGAFVGMEVLIDRLAAGHPLAIEEAFVRMMRDALAAHHCVFVDDLHLLATVLECGNYPRTGLLEAALSAIIEQAAAAGRKMVFGVESSAPDPIAHRSYTWGIREFAPEDYECICRAYLDSEAGGRLDYAQIHRFAPSLNAHQIRCACFWLRRVAGLDTRRFIEYLRAQHLMSNVDLAEVQAVDLLDLKGIEEVIQSLETHIVLPLENEALAAELDLKPKRGVLLAGPPGTGKTTIGTALAHRLKSKFFVIDGTLIAGEYRFYQKVDSVFEAAQRNAPAILFIDDADVIFQCGEEHGFYRYLLTKLDGLEGGASGTGLRVHDGHERRQPAARAGSLGPSGTLVGDAAAQPRFTPRHPSRSAGVSAARDRPSGHRPAGFGHRGFHRRGPQALGGRDRKSVV